MNRDQTLDIIKGIGIILMVVGHSGAPDYVHDIIYTFHMPLFFIASGWFFSELNLEDSKGFAMRKIKSIYFPYWKWCVIFLLLHNVFYSVGIINSAYGASNSSVSHWYSIKDVVVHAVDFTFRMNGYDGYLLGAYWFIRSLLWGSLLLCFSSTIMCRVTKLQKSTIICSVTAISGVLGGAISFFNMHIPFWPQGGYREMMAVFFIGMGYMLRKSVWWKQRYMIIVFVIIIPTSLFVEPTKLATTSTFVMWLLIPFTGLAGYALVYKFSNVIAQSQGKIADCLSYIGRQTFYIMTFHFLMFKPASLLKTYIYDMDWKMIGCHPVIPPEGDNWYWIVYTLTSLILSLGMARIMESIPYLKLK